jgi:hypothetical protein
MPPAGPKGRPEDGSAAVELSDLFASVAGAVLEAKAVLDQEAAGLAEEYLRNPPLGAVSPPGFAIGEVRLVVKYAIARVEEAPSRRRGRRQRASVSVHVDSAVLAETAPHLIAEMEVRIVPEVKRPQATEDDLGSVD